MMRKTLTTLLASGLLAVALVAAAPGAAHAVPSINFAGTTTACFTTGCVPGSSAVFHGLTFSAGAFNVTTDSDGFTGIGGGSDNLGMLTLTSVPNFNYAASPFDLVVHFTAPTVSGDAFFSAVLRGNVKVDGNGVFFDFVGNNSQTLAFTDGNGRTGNFTITVDNFSVTAGSSPAQITGQIVVNSITPEPVSMALLGTGLAGVVGLRRRRKSSDSEK